MAFISLKSFQEYINPLKLSLLNSTTSLLQKSLAKTANNVLVSGKQGFSAASSALKPKAFISQESLQTSTQAAYRLELSRDAQSSAQVSVNGGTTIAQYHRQGKESYKINATLDQLTNKTTNGLSTVTKIGQNKSIVGNSSYALDRTVTASQVSNLYKTSGGYTKETKIDTNSFQGYVKDDAKKSNTDTITEQVVTDAQGKVLKDTYNRRLVDENMVSQTVQNSVGRSSRDVTQDVQSEKTQVGNAVFTSTKIETSDVRDSDRVVQTSIAGNYSAQITNLDKSGALVSTQNINRASQFNEQREVDTEESYNTLRTVDSMVKGNERLTLDSQTVIGQKDERVVANASNLVVSYDKDGNVIGQQLTSSETSSKLDQASVVEAQNMLKQGPEGVKGFGSIQENVGTNINTTIVSTSAQGVVSERNIEREVDRVASRDWSGSIDVNTQKDGSKAYTLSSVDVAKANVVDVTREGQSQLKVGTQQSVIKEIEGSITYKADEVQPVSNIPSSIGVSFGAYTGLASGFKLESGQVDFNLSFTSGEVTEQETVKSSQDVEVSSARSEQGQLTDANLSGSLNSRVGEDGSRIIEVVAAYKRGSEKFVIDSASGQKNVAAGQGDEELQIQGTITLNKDGSVKTMDSDFQIFKVENKEAEGTSLATVRKALDQSDPLRNSFSFDNGNFKFNLGFASLNFAIYA